MPNCNWFWWIRFGATSYLKHALVYELLTYALIDIKAWLESSSLRWGVSLLLVELVISSCRKRWKFVFSDSAISECTVSFHYSEPSVFFCTLTLNFQYVVVNTLNHNIHLWIIIYKNSKEYNFFFVFHCNWI